MALGVCNYGLTTLCLFDRCSQSAVRMHFFLNKSHQVAPKEKNTADHKNLRTTQFV